MPRRIDETGFGAVRILQDSDGFCYGVDAVLLAGFVDECMGTRKTASMRLCDLGTGTGIVPLILSHKTQFGTLWGVEYQEESFAMAQENIALNGLEHRLQFLHGNVADIKREHPSLEALGGAGSFDVITSNPPYTAVHQGMKCDASAKNIARHEIAGSLEDFVQAAALLLKDKGELYLVHRPSRLVDIIATCRAYKLEPKRLRLISGHQGQRPNILLLQAVKNGGVELTVDPPFYVREADGDYSEAVKNVYKS